MPRVAFRIIEFGCGQYRAKFNKMVSDKGWSSLLTWYPTPDHIFSNGKVCNRCKRWKERNYGI